jgi:hypothetical protein
MDDFVFSSEIRGFADSAFALRRGSAPARWLLDENAMPFVLCGFWDD